MTIKGRVLNVHGLFIGTCLFYDVLAVFTSPHGAGETYEATAQKKHGRGLWHGVDCDIVCAPWGVADNKAVTKQYCHVLQAGEVISQHVIFIGDRDVLKAGESADNRVGMIIANGRDAV